MTNKRKTIPTYIQRGLLGLIIFLISLSVARLLVSLHQQQERIEILEEEVAQLLSDTPRLQISSMSAKYEKHSYNSYKHRSYYDRNYFRNASKQRVPAEHDSSTLNPEEAHVLPKTYEKPNENNAEKRKFTEVHQFDLNTIDSVTLIRIPGIAERTASVILKYREKYGGFYTPWQLQEFMTWDAAQAYMEEWCTNWFTADAARIHSIYLNKATVSELQHHPYISHEQAIEILRYRTRHKKITSATELQQFSTFTEDQIKRLLPYLSFE